MKKKTHPQLKKHFNIGALAAFLLCLTLIQIHGDSQNYQANLLSYDSTKQAPLEAPLRDTLTLEYQGETQSFTLAELGIVSRATNPTFFERIFKKNPKQNYSWNEDRSAHLLHQAFDIPKPEEVRIVWNETDMQVQGGLPSEKILVSESLGEALTHEGKATLQTQSVPAQDKSLALSFETFAETLVQESWEIQDGATSYRIPMNPKDFVWNPSAEGLRPSLSSEKMESMLAEIAAKGNIAKQDATIKSIANTEESSKIDLEGLPKNGRTLDKTATQANILQAIQNRSTQVESLFTEDKALLLNESGLPLPALQEIGRGISNYKGTDAGRIHNVEKAVNDVFHAIYIPQGKDFSFNALLGPVTIGAGWKNANIIVNGKDLKKAPGGGVCQAASTIFRAALNAGLPIPKQKNHSLYVHYYTQKAVADDRVYDGLDATIYPGLQDLVFTNDTDSPLVMISYTDENRDVHVVLYGAEQDREVSLLGPISASNQDEASVQSIGKLNRSSLAWKQIIEKDGETVEKWFISRYRGAVKQY